MLHHTELVSWIIELIAEDKLYRFYKSREWLELRAEVLRENHHECQHCLRRGKYTRAVMVHHVNEIRKRPDLALTKEYKDKSGATVTNLVPLCFACHEAEHDRWEGTRVENGREKFKNVERW